MKIGFFYSSATFHSRCEKNRVAFLKCQLKSMKPVLKLVKRVLKSLRKLLFRTVQKRFQTVKNHILNRLKYNFEPS